MTQYTPIVNSITFQNYPIDVLRLDLIHHQYGGNKIFKLKYNLLEAQNQNLNTVLTFGGAHSNHIYSTAAFCKENKLNSIGIIRGEENLIDKSPTLKFALQCGMKLHFVSRADYTTKTENTFYQELKNLYGNFHLVPEGGNNYLGVKGCAEILTDEFKKYDFVFCACGTSATFSGIKISANSNQKVIGISVLKGENKLISDANKWFKLFNSPEISTYENSNLSESTILSTYHFGGYAKYFKDLIEFKNNFEREYKIPLDYIYTSKLFYAVFDLIKSGKIKSDSKILVIHSGGQQGNVGFEHRFAITN